MPPADRHHPAGASTTALRHWLARHLPEQHPATTREPPSQNFPVNSQPNSKSASIHRTPALTRNLALAACAAVAAHVLAAIIIWPALQIHLPPVPSPALAMTERGETSAHPSTDILPGGTKATALASRPNPQPQPTPRKCQSQHSCNPAKR